MWYYTKKFILYLAVGVSLLIAGTALWIYLSIPNVTDLKTKNPKTTALMLQRYRAAKEAKKKFIVLQQWVAFDKIPILLKNAIRVTEDAGFYQHKGVDLTELKIALRKNWEKGKFVRGASTITQQLAKNLYLSTDKSIIRKIKEYFIARRLEAHLKKNRIFNLYLNVIEFGPGLFGVQAAAQYYFNKDVGRLNLEEIVRLTAVIPKPLIENPTKNSPWLRWKVGWILDTLRRNKYISRAQFQATKRRFLK